MIDRSADAAEVRIAAMTVRGPGLSAARGGALATAVAETVARHIGAGAAIEHLTVRLPATVFAADGGIDHGAIADAVGRRARRAVDA